jgi:hypothetical protein
MAATSDSLHNLHSPERSYSGEISVFQAEPTRTVWRFLCWQKCKNFSISVWRDKGQLADAAKCRMRLEQLLLVQ